MLFKVGEKWENTVLKGGINNEGQQRLKPLIMFVMSRLNSLS